MLQNLTISGLAVVKTLNLDLASGMSALTGETGAGKSILLTALGLALGDRADSGYVRPDSKRAEIHLQFDLSDAQPAFHWLQENDLDDEQQCIIRRTINPDGRSKAYINNRPVTLQFLQALSGKLVEIHGQHAHLTLLDTEQQRHLLDDYAGLAPQVDQLNDIYRQWCKAQQELQKRIKNNRDKEEREELLRYQLDELQQLELENFDYAALSEEHNKQANMEQILVSSQQQLDLLYDNDQQSINQLLSHSTNALQELTQLDPQFNEVSELLNDAQIQVQEAAQQLRRHLENQELDPQLMHQLEAQIGLVQSLSRKHQCTPENLPELAKGLQEDLKNLSQDSLRISELQQQTQQLQSHYLQLASQLSEQRQHAADKLQLQISAIIRELGMPQGDFLVSVTQNDQAAPTLNGIDMIDFLVSANPGLPAKSLAKVASGGELSRISLAIQVATSGDKTTPTMIFDEVDSGIGGGIAEIVGKRLRSLGKTRQVLCVTHLPQVASQAHQHLFVSKSNSEEITASTVTKLNDEQRIAEVARMLGGVEMTANTLAHAKEMVQSADVE